MKTKAFTSFRSPFIISLQKSIIFSRQHNCIKYCSTSSSGRVNNSHIEKTPITSALWKDRFSKLNGTDNKSPDSHVNNSSNLEYSITTKLPIESRRGMRYHFSTDPNLKDLYIDNSGNVAMGKLFEDMDALAGNVVYSHCINDHPSSIKTKTPIVDGEAQNNSLPFVSNMNALSLVTACVDDIILHKQNISCSHDIILTGQVGWVGQSSLDVVVEVHSVPSSSSSSSSSASILNLNSNTNTMMSSPVDSQTLAAVTILSPTETPLILDTASCSTRLLASIVTYVARNKLTGKSMKINKLDISNNNSTSSSAAEKIFYDQRELLARNRKDNNLKSLNPDVLKRDKELLLTLVDSGSAISDMPTLAHPNAVLMRSTVLENSFICQPQATNTGGRVFGGFLIHKAYDLAQATSYTFAGRLPTLLEVDKIEFKRPVDVGDLVRLKSRICYSSDDPIRPRVICEVRCQVIRPERASSFVSNTFYFCFGFQNETVHLRRVLPSSMEEAQLIVESSKRNTI